MKSYKSFYPDGFKKTSVKPKFPFVICDRCEHIHANCYIEDTSAGRNIVVFCKHENKCRRLYRMISEEVAHARSGGDGVDKTVD